ncbi:type II secretion system inner membrane protein GspF [Marinicella sp. S1101]|uniref:type II secretion system inner membrane protein GspF n=1 Tax=Marinicella marina TaxID=2996016 RepID=UPI002260F46C|nr:type II secretion system inner membrane protein GspF [Marinicella marina]MCX7553908.1 type II secretion system inner membrane protein GspF [Marinicella marina]MDJ1140400.1 type II secretion system inner membrane protein GspF [Marinicella marina]
MEAFEYISIDQLGKQQKGIIQADNEKQARHLLRQRALTPVQLNLVIEQVSNTSDKTGNNIKTKRLALKKTELPLLIRQLATLVQAGLPLDDALKTLIEQSETKTSERILTSVHAKVLEGQSLAAAMRQFPKAFDELVATSIEAGEQSGQLEAVLLQLADYLETRDEMGKQSTSALIYPLVLIVTAVAVVAGLMVYIVPKVIQVFESSQVQLPAMTRVLISVSSFLSSYGIYLLAFLLLLFIGFLLLRQYPPFELGWHRWLLRLPGIGRLIRVGQAARFTRTLGILTQSAVPIVSALSLSRQVVNNRIIEQACDEVAAAVREGSSLAKAMQNTQQFPPLSVKLVSSGEQSGQLSEMLVRAAVVQEKDVENKLKTLIGAIQPLAILFVGLMVLFIVLAMLLPIFQINTIIQ